ncbi:MAG: AAA domain-containing protein [Lachnospiraceae bacterium]|nr:AAA domain-containing protein [Lachnospiraceae bacterium]
MKKANKTEFDKNMILYGPPGTGKTYHSVIYAVAICDGKSLGELEDHNVVMARYHELKKAGRIAFTTFHQSYGYEEFIEGIKPVVDDEKRDLGYLIEPGIFKKFCEKAKSVEITADKHIIDTGAKIWKLTIMNGDYNQIKRECFEENNVRMGFDMDSDEARAFVEDVNPGDIILSFKTRKTIDGIAVVTDEAVELEGKKLYRTARPVNWLAKNIDEDITDINGGKILHRMTFAKVPYMNVQDVIALAEKVNPRLGHTVIKENTEPYVFIIDEINRGNISKIFGELITLIENTKRAGMPEAISAVLPYSGTEFSVPSNVYILGTMNTADRSIAMMDTALRRRFQFIEMMANPQVLRTIHADRVEDLDVAAMLEKINERITFLYDREHTIGHAFFTDLKGENATVEKLQSIFEKSVIPLLQEYFYEDYQKIQFVLGDNDKSSDELKFIVDEKVIVKNIFKGSVEEVMDLPEKRYSMNKAAFQNINSYKEII